MSQLSPAARTSGAKTGHVWPSSSPNEKSSGRPPDARTSTSDDPVLVIVDPLIVNVPTALVPKFTRFGLARSSVVPSADAGEAIVQPTSPTAKQTASPTARPTVRTLFMGISFIA